MLLQPQLSKSALPSGGRFHLVHPLLRRLATFGDIGGWVATKHPICHNPCLPMRLFMLGLLRKFVFSFLWRFVMRASRSSDLVVLVLQ